MSRDKDSQLIWESYINVTESPNYDDYDYDPYTGRPNRRLPRYDTRTGRRLRPWEIDPEDDEPGLNNSVGGERGIGFSQIFNEKIQVLLNDSNDQDEMLQQCLKVKDQAVNVVKNFQAIISSLDVDRAVDFLCLRELEGSVSSDENRLKIWDTLSRWSDHERVKDIPPEMLLTHMLQRQFGESQSEDCATAREMLAIPVLGKTVSGTIFTLIKKIAQLTVDGIVKPFLTDMEGIQTLDDFKNIDLILLQYDAKVQKIGKKFLDWFEGFQKTVGFIMVMAMGIVKAAGKTVEVTTGGALQMAVRSPKFLQNAAQRLRSVETPALPNKPPLLGLPNK